MRLHDFFDHHAREHPERPCIEFGGPDAELCGGRGAKPPLARALLAQGLAPGERFGLLAKNALEYLLFFLAGSKTGIVPVPLNYRLAPPELAYIVNDARARLVVARGECVAAFDSARASCPDAKTCVALDAPARPGWLDYRRLDRGRLRRGRPSATRPARKTTSTRCTRAERRAARRARSSRTAR